MSPENAAPEPGNTERRHLVKAVVSAGLLGLMNASHAAETLESDTRLPANVRLPTLEFTYECDATLSEAQPFGPTLEGQRRIIPITGGTFKGPHMRGQVLSGGADWNLSRSDGGSSVEAAYYLRTDDGVILRVVNKGVGGGETPSATTSAEVFYMFTAPVIEAPTGKYDWTNRSMFVATLGARRGSSSAVVIRVFKLT